MKSLRNIKEKRIGKEAINKKRWKKRAARVE
jgi:hypothetical protein